MSFRSRSWASTLVLSLLALLGGSAVEGAMTLEFAITPMVQPHSGSLDKDASGTIVATNLAVTSVTSVETAKVVQLSKYLDLQSAGTTGPNFFILDGMVQQYAGTAPVAMSSPIGSTSLTANGSGYLFKMMIQNATVANPVAADFGLTGGSGWTGVLVLNIAAFNSSLGSDQVSSGTLFLTSPSAAPVTIPADTVTVTPPPAGEVITAAVVPEPSSLVLGGMGLMIVLGRFGPAWTRSKA